MRVGEMVLVRVEVTVKDSKGDTVGVPLGEARGGETVEDPVGLLLEQNETDAVVEVVELELALMAVLKVEVTVRRAVATVGEAEEEEQSVGARVRVNKFVGPPEGREGLGLEEKLGVTDTVGV